MRNLIRACGLVVLTAILCGPPQAWASAATGRQDVVMTSMEKELQRAKGELGKLTPAPYFISYTVYDQQASFAVGMNGSLVSGSSGRKRMADVIMRVGAPALDNGHGESRPSAINTETLPFDDDPDAIAHALWRLTFSEYRKASTAFLNVQTKSQVKAKEDDLSADFSKERAQTHADYGDAAPAPQQKEMENFARRFSAGFRNYPYIYSSAVVVSWREIVAALCFERRWPRGDAGNNDTRGDPGRDPSRRWNGVDACGDLAGRVHGQTSWRYRDRCQGGRDGQGSEVSARSSGG